MPDTGALYRVNYYDLCCNDPTRSDFRLRSLLLSVLARKMRGLQLENVDPSLFT